MQKSSDTTSQTALNVQPSSRVNPSSGPNAANIPSGLIPPPGSVANSSQNPPPNSNNHTLDFIIQYGELGQSFTYHNIPASKEITHLQGLIQTDTKIDIQNQYLVPKSGFQIQQDDILGDIERQNALSQTQRLVDQSKFKSFHVLFVFNEKALLDQSENIPQFIHQEQQTQLASFNKIAADVKAKTVKLDPRLAESDFQWGLSLTEDDIKILMKVSPNAIDIETKLYKFYASMKKKAYEYLQKQARIEKGCKEIDVQSSAIEAILMRAINEYQICKKFSSDIQLKVKGVNENMTKILAKYEEALHLGRTTDLPEILKKDGRKHIFDVYYGLHQMESWKDHCIKRMENLKSLFTQNQAEVKNIKLNIKGQRSATTTSATQMSNELVKKIEEQSKEGGDSVLSAFLSVYEEYKALRKSIQAVLENPSNVEAAGSSLESVMLKAAAKLSEQDGIERTAVVKIEALFGFFATLQDHKIKTYPKMQKCHQKLAPILKDLSKLSHERFKQFSTDLAAVDKDFNDFHKPYQFFNSFKTILKEVSRRNEFQVFIDRYAKFLNGIIVGENEKRKAFIYHYGKCLPKDFIPELNTFAKLILEPAMEKYPRIEGEHDDKYSDLFKQFESQEFALKQEEKIQELRRELARLKDPSALQSAASAAAQSKLKKYEGESVVTTPSSASTQASHTTVTAELKSQVNMLKSEIESLNSNHPSKKAEETLRIQLDIETKRTNVLQNKVLALENQVRVLGDDQEKNHTIAKLQKELDEMDKAYKNIHQYYQKDNKENLPAAGGAAVVVVTGNGEGTGNGGVIELGSEEAQRTIQKLSVRVTNLTALLQQTSKVALSAFLRKSNENQAKLTDKITLHEQRFLNFQENALVEKNKLVTFYDEKIKAAENRFYAEKKSMLSSLELAKEQYKEELAHLNSSLKHSDADLADKNKQLRTAHESIAKLNSQINQKQREYEELSKKSQLVESKLKQDLMKQVGDAQAASLKEQERLKKRIQQLEVDITNKATLQTNALRDLNNLKRELDLKTDEHSKVLLEVDTMRRENEGMKRDVLNLKNKIENLESGNEKRNREMAGLTKQLNVAMNEKQVIADELAKEKHAMGEVTKKLQSALESVRVAESEKARLSKAVDSERLEVEKKSHEVANLSMQIAAFSQQKTLDMERHKESQMTDQQRVADLKEDVNKYRIEVNAYSMKVQILESDLTAREEEIRILKENIDRLRDKVEENEAKIDELTVNCERLESENELKTMEIANLNAAYDQALIEGEIQQKNATTNKNLLEKKEDEYHHQLERLQNEIRELQRNIEICQEREKKTNGLNEEIISELNDVRAKLVEKEKEFSILSEEVSVGRSTMNLKEMSLKQMSSEMRERDDAMSATQATLARVNEQLEESQRVARFAQAELDEMQNTLRLQRENAQLLQTKNLELQDSVNELTNRQVDYEKLNERALMEKDIILEAHRELEEGFARVQEEKKVLYDDNTILAKQLESLQANTICIDVHQLKVEKLEQEIQEKEGQIQDIIKEQGQLAEQLIAGEITQKELRAQITSHDSLTQKHLQTIERLSHKVNVEKNDRETQWIEEEENESKGMTLSASEANKFKKILKGIDSNKRIPVLSSRAIEHMDISQALRRTALIQDTINFTRLEEGTKMLFIPTSDSVYVPLVLRQINEGAIQAQQLNAGTATGAADHSIMSSDSFQIVGNSFPSYKNNFFLDFDTLDRKYKELLKECSLLMVATIKNIIPKQAWQDNSSFGLKENESYYLLQVETPEYIVGLEDDDHSIKNYA